MENNLKFSIDKIPYFYEFTLPGLPKMTNRMRSNWATRARESRVWKAMVFTRICRNRPEKPLKQAKLTLTRHSSISPDSDGLVSGFKHIIDGLVEAKVLENDRFENIGMPDYKWARAGQRNGFLTVSITEITEKEIA